MVVKYGGSTLKAYVKHFVPLQKRGISIIFGMKSYTDKLYYQMNLLDGEGIP